MIPAATDDSLGSLKFSTKDLTLEETYESAFIRSDKEGSLYEITFVVEPYFLPSSRAEAAKIKEKIVARAANNRAAVAACFKQQRRLEEAQEQARRVQREVEEAAYEIDKLSAILKASGKDGVAKYLNLQEWNQAYLKECHRQDELPKLYRYKSGNVGETISREIIPGTWRVGRINARGEKDQSGTWTYNFTRRMW